jgi:hypothetical protein
MGTEYSQPGFHSLSSNFFLYTVLFSHGKKEREKEKLFFDIITLTITNNQMITVISLCVFVCLIEMSREENGFGSLHGAKPRHVLSEI